MRQEGIIVDYFVNNKMYRFVISFRRLCQAKNIEKNIQRKEDKEKSGKGLGVPESIGCKPEEFE
jgi:hypothetical protein